MPTLEELPDDPPGPSSAAPSASPRPTASPSALPELSEPQLETLLKSLPARLPPASLSPAEADLLLGSFAPDVDARSRSLAFLILAHLSSALPDDPTALGRPFVDRIEDVLVGTSARETERVLAFLAALSQTAPAAALALVNRPGMHENLFDLVDLFPASDPSSLAVARVLADLVSQLCNSAQGRTALLSVEGADWKQTLGRQSASATFDPALRATATVALAKLSRGTVEGGADGGSGAGGAADPAAGEQERQLGKSDERLAVVLKAIVEASAVPGAVAQPKAVVDAVEGLALTSFRPRIKELLSASRPFLAKLFALVPPPPRARAFNDPTPGAGGPAAPLSKAATASSVQYGVATIVCHLVAYRLVLSAEQAQIDRLRKMTLAKQAPKGGPPPPTAVEDDPLDDDRAVSLRAKRLLDAGVVEVLVALARADSRIVRETVGRALLALVHDAADRTAVVKAGGAKALLALGASLLAPPASPPSASAPTAALPALDASLPALQALAKLLITTSPFAIFGPAASSSAADGVRPLAALLGHPSSSLLQRFEALMALTNLASIDPTMASRIAAFDAGAVVRQMEDLMLDDNALVRRAAVELLCNLLAAEPVFLAWAGEPVDVDGQPTAAQTRAAEKKLHVLVALCTVPDVPTQLATAGALATLAASPIACRLMLVRKEGPARPVQSLLELLLPATNTDDARGPSAAPTTVAHPGLVHRAAVILAGVLAANDGNAAVSLAFAAAGARAIVADALEDVEVGMAKGDAAARDEIAAVLRDVRGRLPGGGG